MHALKSTENVTRRFFSFVTISQPISCVLEFMRYVLCAFKNFSSRFFRGEYRRRPNSVDYVWSYKANFDTILKVFS